MSNPQQPELRRSGLSPADQDSWVNDATGAPATSDIGGPIPEGNAPGHHPEHEQDKPDRDRFAEAFGIRRDDAPAQDGGGRADTA